MTTSGAAAGRTPQRRRGDSGAHRAAGSDAAGPAAEPSTTDTEPDDSMNVDAIKQILDLVREHELTEFELEQGGVKLRVKQAGRGPARAGGRGAAAGAAAGPGAGAPSPPCRPPSRRPRRPPADELLELSVVTSPIVGTFYRSPDPSSPSFVEVGQRVKKGQTLCIIEAMKLMNEIESEYEGEIVKVYVENGQPVQYGERLFAVKTT